MTEDTQMAPERTGTVKDALLVLLAAFVTVAVIVACHELGTSVT
jgi:hypothetical protein